MIHNSIVAGWHLTADSRDPAVCFGGADVAGKASYCPPILLPSQGSAPPKCIAGFFFGATAMGALVNGPAWASSHGNTGRSDTRARAVRPVCEGSRKIWRTAVGQAPNRRIAASRVVWYRAGSKGAVWDGMDCAIHPWGCYA